MQRIDPRQVETFLSSPTVVEDIGPSTAQKWGGYVSREREKTKWVAEGNVVLPSGELIRREEFGKLPADEQRLLRELGVEGFNKFREENIKLEDSSWLSKATDEYKVLGAIMDGYSSYEEMTQVTGLTRSQIGSAIEALRGKGMIK